MENTELHNDNVPASNIELKEWVAPELVEKTVKGTASGQYTNHLERSGNGYGVTHYQS